MAQTKSKFTSIETGYLRVKNNVQIDGTVSFGGTSWTSATTFNGAVTFNSTTTFNGPATFASTCTHNGPATFNSTSTFNGPATFNSTSTHNGATTFNSTTTFNGPATFASTCTHSGPLLLTYATLPNTFTASGVAGTIVLRPSNAMLYICMSTNSWYQVALSNTTAFN